MSATKKAILLLLIHQSCRRDCHCKSLQWITKEHHNIWRNSMMIFIMNYETYGMMPWILRRRVKYGWKDELWTFCSCLPTISCWLWLLTNFFSFVVADTRLNILPCRSVGRSVRPSVRHIFEFRAVFTLLLLPNCPRLDCRVSGLVEFRAVFTLLLLPNRPRLDCRVTGLVFLKASFFYFWGKFKPSIFLECC